MEERLSILKNNFNIIVDFKENNISSLQLLEMRIKKIKEIYAGFINANRDNLFVFTLDSFHFQGKLIDIEYEDMMRLFYAITNRMYCDYYKLFKIIIEYVKEFIPDKKLCELIKVNDNFPAYKDLEPFKQYEFHYIQSLHEIILVILNYLNTFIINKDHDLKVYQLKNKIGLNIDSFVNTFNFNNTVMKEKTTLFITYVEFFHKLHTKYLKRYTMKLQLMMSQINNDIKLDNPNENANAKKDVLNDLKENNIDKHILRELKISVSDENSIISTEKSNTPDTRYSSKSNLSDSSNIPDIRNSSISNASDSSNEQINLDTPISYRSDTPISNEIMKSNSNEYLCESTILYEQMSELSDDNKLDICVEPKFALPNIQTIVEDDESNNDNYYEDDDDEENDQENDKIVKETLSYIIEKIVENSSESPIDTINDSNNDYNNKNKIKNKKKKMKKKNKQNGLNNESIPNITI